MQYVTQNESQALLSFASEAADKRVRRRTTALMATGDDRDEGRLTLRGIALAVLFALPMWGALAFIVSRLFSAL